MSVYRRLIRSLGHSRAFALVGRRFGSRLDRRLYRASGGRLSTLGFGETPMLLLTTVGRRSGVARTTPLIFIRDGESFVVSSEDFGQPRPAAWPLNLDADPRAEVQVGSEVTSCVATRLSERDADRYWPQLVQAWPAHATYRTRSRRRHTFVLAPRSSAAAYSTASGELADAPRGACTQA
jgi:deazaflavin-dependent oxidoreductase (nitroreductase family)